MDHRRHASSYGNIGGIASSSLLFFTADEAAAGQEAAPAVGELVAAQAGPEGATA